MESKIGNEVNMSIYTTVIADLKSEHPNGVLTTKQGDINSRFFTVKLTLDGQEYIIPNNVKARYAITKPYKTAIWNDCDKIENNIIYGKLTSESLKNSGVFPMHIELYTEKEKLTTANFLLKVLPSARIADEQVGKNEYGVLDNLIYKINDSINNSNSNIEDIKKFKLELIEAENNRKQSEIERNNSEISRNNSENIRSENEKKRQTSTDNAIKKTEAAVLLANNSSASANSAAERANSAAKKCEEISKNFINDLITTESTTWSSKKINNEFNSLKNSIEASFEDITKSEIDALFNVL